MFRKLTLVLVGALVGFCFAQQVPEDSLLRMLERAKTYYNNGEYEFAIRELEVALQFLKQYEQSDQVEAYKYLAFSYVAFGELDKAKEQFKRALTLNPKLELDPATVSPKIIKVFEEAKAELAVEPPPVEPKPVEPVKPPAEKKKVSTFQATMRSACVPGWGQIYKGQTSKGTRLLILHGITFSSTVLSLILREGAHNDYLDVPADDPGGMEDAYNKYKFWYNVSAVSFVAFLGVYTYNLIDVIVSKPTTTYSGLGHDGLYCGFDGTHMKVGYSFTFLD